MVVCVGCLLFGWLVNSVDFYFFFRCFYVFVFLGLILVIAVCCLRVVCLVGIVYCWFL